MAEKVRLRVWLLGGLPIVLVVAVVALVVGITRKKPAPAHALAAKTNELPTATTVAEQESAVPFAPAVATVTAPPRPAPAAIAPPTAASSGESPEPIPELSELHRPPGSEGWTPEQKAEYRRKVFDDLDARERTLEREEAAARRAGDSETERRKATTLAYLRDKRALVERMMGAQQAREAQSAQAAEADAGQ